MHQASLEHNARRFPDGWRRRLYLAAKRAHPKYHLYQALERRQYDPTGGARVVVAVSRFVEGHLQRYHAVAPERIRVIPNAIDTDRLAVAAPAEVRARTRAGLGLKPDDLVALFVAHNFRLKGLPDLLHALALRARHVPAARPIQLLVCGGGRRAPMRRLAARLGLEPNVRLLGFLPDVRAVFHAADLFVLPTYYDPCSLVVFEALACGLPVITTACNGAAELITPGREGFVIPEPAAHAALAQALEALSDDRRRAACAAQARDLGRRQSLDRHLAALLSLCEQVAAAKRRHAGTGFPPQRKRGRDASHRPGRR